MLVSITFAIYAVGMSDALQMPQYPTARCRTTPRSRRLANLQYASSSIMNTRKLLSLSSLNESDSIKSDVVNGDHLFSKLESLEDMTASGAVTIDPGDLLPEAPPISYSKFLTMQEKRVVVTIRYSGDAGLKPYFLTMVKKVKASHPDVFVERRILPPVVDGEATFEVLVDNKVVIGKNRHRNSSSSKAGGRGSGGGGGGVDMTANIGAVFVSMSELDLAITRARRKQRPTNVYGDNAGSEVNKKSKL